MDERVAEELADHPAFDREAESFAVTTTVFEATVTSADGAVLVRVRVPTIDAVVAGETVAHVVQEGWFETFERRLEDVGGVTRRELGPAAVTLEEAAGEVVVEVRLPTGRPGIGDDAKAVVDYVEGTFVEGVIPGYRYREPVAGLIERARSAGEQ